MNVSKNSSYQKARTYRWVAFGPGKAKGWSKLLLNELIPAFNLWIVTLVSSASTNFKRSWWNPLIKSAAISLPLTKFELVVDWSSNFPKFEKSKFSEIKIPLFTFRNDTKKMQKIINGILWTSIVVYGCRLHGFDSGECVDPDEFKVTMPFCSDIIPYRACLPKYQSLWYNHSAITKDAWVEKLFNQK